MRKKGARAVAENHAGIDRAAALGQAVNLARAHLGTSCQCGFSQQIDEVHDSLSANTRDNEFLYCLLIYCLVRGWRQIRVPRGWRHWDRLRYTAHSRCRLPGQWLFARFFSTSDGQPKSSMQ